MFQPVSSLYIHFPFCQHLCNYCDFYKKIIPPASVSEQKFSSFHQYLQQSMVPLKELMKEKKVQFVPLETLYIGGGTPSLWGTAGAEFLQQFFHQHGLTLATSGEFTMEVNPGGWTSEQIARWREFGINRFSIGLQSLNAEFLTYLDRFHSLEDSYETLEYFHRLGVNYSVDFMLGLPHSWAQAEGKRRDILGELTEVMKFRPHHLSLYILTTKGQYPLQKNLPDDDFIREEYLMMAQFLERQGYEHYEVSNFALPSLHSRHNQKYWDLESVAALGPSATGLFISSHSFDASPAVRFKWKVQSAEMVLEQLGAKELELEKLYLSLRTSKGMDLSALVSVGADQDCRRLSLEKVIKSWHQRGYLRAQDGLRLQLSSLGFLMLDSVMNDLFPLMPADS